jgi:hypothetical protein
MVTKKKSRKGWIYRTRLPSQYSFVKNPGLTKRGIRLLKNLESKWK